MKFLRFTFDVVISTVVIYLDFSSFHLVHSEFDGWTMSEYGYLYAQLLVYGFYVALCHFALARKKGDVIAHRMLQIIANMSPF